MPVHTLLSCEMFFCGDEMGALGDAQPLESSSKLLHGIFYLTWKIISSYRLRRFIQGFVIETLTMALAGKFTTDSNYHSRE